MVSSELSNHLLLSLASRCFSIQNMVKESIGLKKQRSILCLLSTWVSTNQCCHWR